MTRTDATCRSLVEVPGIGPIIATALLATMPGASTFRSGRHLAAWLGLALRQHSSGGKDRVLGLSKRGDAYLRRQLIHGARALVEISQGREGKLWAWINELRARRPFSIVVAAVASKLVRIVWAMLSRGEAYRAAAWRKADQQCASRHSGQRCSDLRHEHELGLIDNVSISQGEKRFYELRGRSST